MSLVNGKRVGELGSAFQYVFSVENALNAPGDAPGGLYVEGSPPLEVVIVSVDGLAVTLSVPIDLGPFVPKATEGPTRNRQLVSDLKGGKSLWPAARI